MKKIFTNKNKRKDKMDKSITLYTDHIDKFANDFGDEGTIQAINVIVECSTKGEFAYEKLWEKWMELRLKKNKEGLKE